MLVVIPSAGTGSRLDFNTQYFNKAMIQLGDLPVISRIIDSYPIRAKFIVILGYKSEHIEEYLNLTYKKNKIKFCKVGKFEGTGSSLTLTLKSAFNKINEPFFFHANDTIFLDKDFYNNIKDDTMYIYNGPSDTLKYASVQFERKKSIIHPKLNYLRKDFFDYTGVAYIKNYNLFKKILQEKNANRGELEYFFNTKNIKFRFIKYWLDIGSKDTKEKAENYFQKKNILPKYDQGIFFKNRNVIKFFTDHRVVKKRFKRSLILKKFVPNIKKCGKYFYIYNLINGKIFSEIKKTKNFINLLAWLQGNFWTKKVLTAKKYELFKNKCHNFYYEKTYSRVNFLYEKNNLVDASENINGIKTPRLSKLMNLIDWNDMDNGMPVNFHGDLHFENIIYKNNNFFLLDWREDFDGLLEYGDIYYDLAKLNHGFIIDHKIIKQKKFNVKINNKFINISYSQSINNKKFQKIFFDFLKANKYSVKKVKILTALIYLNISSLHHYPYSIFLYYLGKLSLYKALLER